VSLRFFLPGNHDDRESLDANAHRFDASMVAGMHGDEPRGSTCCIGSRVPLSLAATLMSPHMLYTRLTHVLQRLLWLAPLLALPTLGLLLFLGLAGP
jgi:hypothetical protein